MLVSRFFALCLTLLAALSLTFGAFAQAQGTGGAPNITARLVASNPSPPPGSTTDIAIEMTPAPTWHGYWVNGGDAGFGMQVEWDLPPGVTLSPLRYPVPDTLIIAGLMNHVYEHPYALLAQITVPGDLPPGSPIPIIGRAQWLACTEQVCVPERATLSLDLVVGEVGAGPAPIAKFAEWQRAIPQPLAQAARYAVAGDLLRIAIPLPASVTLNAPHLFVETQHANKPGGAQRFLRAGDWLIVETPLGSGIEGDGTIDALLRIAPGRGLSFHAQRGDVPAGGTVIASVPSAKDGGAPRAGSGGTSDAGPASGPFNLSLFLTAVIGAIMGGLILNIMPCVFPILSLKALALARAGGDERDVRREGFAYTFGAIFACAALGIILLLLRASGEAVGWAFQLQRPESVILLIVLMSAITANLAGLFEFSTLRLTARGGDGTPSRNAFLTGALAAFIATPCTGPFLGAALGATLTLPSWAAVPVFAALGFGLALPFLALALVPALRNRLPRPGAWMNTLRRWLAVPMALTVLALIWLLGRQVGATGWLLGGLLLITTFLLALWAGKLQRTSGNTSIAIILMVVLIIPASLLLERVAPPTGDANTPHAAEANAWSPAALSAARKKGAVFVNFTADWCLSCKVNEAAAIDRDETRRAFAAHNVTMLTGDWTNADPAITAELARHGRNSVPLYLWYPAGGGAAEVLPQILAPGMLSERAAK